MRSACQFASSSLQVLDVDRDAVALHGDDRFGVTAAEQCRRQVDGGRELPVAPASCSDIARDYRRDLAPFLFGVFDFAQNEIAHARLVRSVMLCGMPNRSQASSRLGRFSLSPTMSSPLIAAVVSK